MINPVPLAGLDGDILELYNLVPFLADVKTQTIPLFLLGETWPLTVQKPINYFLPGRPVYPGP